MELMIEAQRHLFNGKRRDRITKVGVHDPISLEKSHWNRFAKSTELKSVRVRRQVRGDVSVDSSPTRRSSPRRTYLILVDVLFTNVCWQKQTYPLWEIGFCSNRTLKNASIFVQAAG